MTLLARSPAPPQKCPTGHDRHATGSKALETRRIPSASSDRALSSRVHCGRTGPRKVLNLSPLLGVDSFARSLAFFIFRTIHR